MADVTQSTKKVQDWYLLNSPDHQKCFKYHNARTEEVQTECTVTVVLQESHQEAKPHKNHDSNLQSTHAKLSRKAPGQRRMRHRWAGWARGRSATSELCDNVNGYVTTLTSTSSGRPDAPARQQMNAAQTSILTCRYQV